MCGEGVDEGDSSMRVIRNGRGRGWYDSAKFDGDVKTDGGPVGVTRVDSFLVLAHGIDLDVGLTFANERRMLPGYNILDVFIGKSMEDDDVAMEK